MFISIDSMVQGSILTTAGPPPASTSDFFSSQLFGIIIGGTISAVVSFVGIIIVNRQQEKRDERVYKRQVEREKEAYIRSLKDAKRDRLRAAYKVILSAAETHKQVVGELQFPLLNEPLETHEKRLYNLLSESLVGVDDAMDEITLEDEELSLRYIFTDMNIAFQTYARDLALNEKFHRQVTQEDLTKEKNLVIEKAEELKAVMKRHLREMEH